MSGIAISIRSIRGENAGSRIPLIVEVAWQDDRGMENRLLSEEILSPSLDEALNTLAEFESLYEDWGRYSRYGGIPDRLARGIEIPLDIITNYSEYSEDEEKERRRICTEKYNRLIFHLDGWLYNLLLPVYGKISGRIARDYPESPIKITIDTNDINWQNLPWECCKSTSDLLSDNSRYQVSTAIGGSRMGIVQEWCLPLRILVVAGMGEGLDLAGDIELIKDHTTNCQIVCLLAQTNDRFQQIEAIEGIEIRPLSNETLNSSLWDESWDIFIFAGHSMTDDNGQTGTIELDRQENISIQNLSQALRQATSNGLKLILFNSCQGMGLARQITNSLANSSYGCPSIVVMRRNIMDKIAHTFLSRFLVNFFEKRWTIDRSVAEANRYLANLESDAPGATSLPVLWSDSRLLPLKLPLQDPVEITQILKPKRHWLKIAIFFSIGFLLALGLWWRMMATTTTDICDFSKQQDRTLANLSCGERSLLSLPPKDPTMKWFKDTEGMKIFADGNNYIAAKELEKEWKQNINPDSNNNPSKNSIVNPEIAIAKNNANAMRDKTSKPLRTIAALMPFPRNEDRESNAELHHISRVILSGIAQAQEEWNEGNNHDWQARVVMGIDKNDPQYAKDSLIKKIFDRPQVLATIGPYSSYVAMENDGNSGIVSEFNRHQLTLISATTTAPLPDTARYRYFFRTPSTNEVQAQKIIDFLKARGIARVSLYHGRKIFSKTLQKNLIERQGNISFSSHDTSSQEYTSEKIKKALSSDKSQAIVLCPDAFSNPNDRKNSQQMIRMLLQKEIEIPLIGNEAVNEPWLMEEIESKSDREIGILNENLFFSLSWNESVDKTNISRVLWQKNPVWWRDKYGQVYGRTALAYDATNIVLQAIDLNLKKGMEDDRKIRENLPDAIREVTNNPSAKWLTGRITFKEGGSDRVQQLNGFVKPIFTKKPDGSLKVEFQNPLPAANPT